jgi:hypothetical protein
MNDYYNPRLKESNLSYLSNKYNPSWYVFSKFILLLSYILANNINNI